MRRTVAGWPVDRIQNVTVPASGGVNVAAVCAMPPVPLVNSALLLPAQSDVQLAPPDNVAVFPSSELSAAETPDPSANFQWPRSPFVGSVVEMHGGRVQAHSSGLGKGSEFIVRLPALANAPMRVSEPADLNSNEKGRSLRILIVEDNIDSGDTLSMLLRLEGHDVLLMRSGITALEAGPAFRPEVVLCDNRFVNAFLNDHRRPPPPGARHAGRRRRHPGPAPGDGRRLTGGTPPLTGG